MTTKNTGTYHIKVQQLRLHQDTKHKVVSDTCEEQQYLLMLTILKII